MPKRPTALIRHEVSRDWRRTLKGCAVLQYLLYAEAKRSVLIVLQGIDAAGKDGVIRHVMAGMNPQGVTVTPFKVPEGEEKAARLSLAYPQSSARMGPDRHLQPVPLRGGSGCPGSQSGSEAGMGEALLTDQRLRADAQ